MLTLAMAENAIDFETGQTLNALVHRVGGMDEALRLGFAYQDLKGVMTLSTAGFAYLTYIVAGDIANPAEAFAAGYEAACLALGDEATK